MAYCSTITSRRTHSYLPSSKNVTVSSSCCLTCVIKFPRHCYLSESMPWSSCMSDIAQQSLKAAQRKTCSASKRYSILACALSLADVNSTTYRTCETSWAGPAAVRTSIPQSPSQNYQYRGTTGSCFPAFIKLRASSQKHPPGHCFGPPAREN